MESTRRHFPDGLAVFIATRDDGAAPWCDAPIRHTDDLSGRSTTDTSDPRRENAQSVVECTSR